MTVKILPGAQTTGRARVMVVRRPGSATAARAEDLGPRDPCTEQYNLNHDDLDVICQCILPPRAVGGSVDVASVSFPLQVRYGS